MDLYTAIAALFRSGWRALDLQVRSTGHANIPDEGGIILASNHIGYLDFCFVALAPPKPRRQVRFLIRHDVFDHRLVGTLLHRMDQVPLEVHGDPTPGMARAEELLRAGEVVGVHPEGTISPSFVPRAGRTGTVRLAQASGVPIVPVALWGSHRLLTKWRPRRLRRGLAVEVHYGEPYEPPPGDPSAATEELMKRIGSLLEDAQQAYPQRPGPPPDDWWIPAHLGGSAPTPDEAEERLRRQAEERRRQARQRHGGDPGKGDPPAPNGG